MLSLYDSPSEIKSHERTALIVHQCQSNLATRKGLHLEFIVYTLQEIPFNCAGIKLAKDGDNKRHVELTCVFTGLYFMLIFEGGCTLFFKHEARRGC